MTNRICSEHELRFCSNCHPTYEAYTSQDRLTVDATGNLEVTR